MRRSVATKKPRALSVAPARLAVDKTYKMFVGGAFVRSESGRYFQVKVSTSTGGGPRMVNVPRGSRKDGRDAVLAAKGALAGWSARTAYNRGQILYRLAEVMEARKGELSTSVAEGDEAGEAPRAPNEVGLAIDRTVFYAGFADKFQSLLGSYDPVAGPYFGFSLPEPMGIVAVVAPARPSLLGLVSTVLPVVCGGNTCVVLASESDPRTAVVFSECLATSDLPAGVINVLTGYGADIAVHLASHREINALQVFSPDEKLRRGLARKGAESIKRVTVSENLPWEDWSSECRGQGIGWIERFVETKSLWHPIGL